MEEQSRQLRRQAAVVGGAMILTGLIALTMEIVPGAADALIKFWPTGIIAVGVALLFPKTQRQ